MEHRKKSIRWNVMIIPLFVIILAVILNVANYDLFLVVTTAIVNWILNNFAWMFNGITLVVLAIVVIAYFSPIKDVRFGGSSAHPIVSYTNYIWIVLCTIMGAGLMLWACAEPLYHIYEPPANIAGGALSGEAVLWAMETIFLEWTFSPMAIYALPTILFAFVFYNMKKEYSVGAMLTPLLGDNRTRKFSPLIDMICLFCICFGLAASLGSGVFLVTEGLSVITNGIIPNNEISWAICGGVIIVSFTLSASIGLQKGLKRISQINAWFYLILGIFVFVCGPTRYILNLCVESFGVYLSDFFKLSLWTSTAYGDGWSLWWPQFYWCVWLAWMPISGIFLGKISLGYTVRETLNVVFWIPAAFSVIWMALFSETSIFFELSEAGLYELMGTEGVAAAAYGVLQRMPLSALIIPLFLVTAFLSYVTTADANTNAIAGLCTVGLTQEDCEASVGLKFFWGISIGALCLIMMIAYGIDGMKMLADLGGFPAAFLIIAFLLAWLKIAKNPQKYDVHKEDYDMEGKPILSKRNSVVKENEVKEK